MPEWRFWLFTALMVLAIAAGLGRTIWGGESKGKDGKPYQ